MIRDFISLIFPINCLNCGQSLISEETYLCTSCKIDLPITNDHINQNNDLLKKFAFQPKIYSARALLHYNNGGIAQTLIHNLKYKGKVGVGSLIGKWMAETLSDICIDEIIPVPLHVKKLRRRGFNQSEVIAKAIANELSIELNTNCVSRIINTKSQTRKSKAERWINMQNVFSEVDRDLSGKSILVLDDVITTGATVGMLCERLVEANVKEIHLAAIARGK